MNVKPKLPSVQITEHLYRKASCQRIPLSGTFELSPVCNFACKMCYVRKTAKEVQQSPRPILTLDDWRRIAREARDAGMVYLLLTGGEPFLWSDFWTLYEELIQMGFVISINTNGSMIDEEAIERMKKLPPRRINITLYGAGDETYRNLCGISGVFDRVDRAIVGLKKAGIPLRLNCSLTPYNVSDLEQMLDYAEQHEVELAVNSYMFPPIRRDSDQIGVNEARFSPEDAAKYRLLVYKRQNSPKNYRRLLEDILKGYVDPPGLDENCVDPVDGRIRCRAGKATFWVTWDGWVTPCGMMTEPKIDLTGRSFREIWEELTQTSAALRLSGVCEKCPNVHICHPCAAMALAETGTAAGIPRYLCLAAREMRKIAARELESEILANGNPVGN